jgi:glycosyltransferase involved in cell wall biosynthesis
LIFKIAASCPEITFLLVGGDPTAIAAYQKKTKILGLENVVFVGFIPNAELPEYQAACDVLLMPYQHHVEASSGGNIADYLSPMKLFEYLACGRVILSSDLPVLREILNENNAILLPPDDVDAWIEALKAISTNPGRHQSLARQARVDSYKYSWDHRAERIFCMEA